MRRYDKGDGEDQSSACHYDANDADASEAACFKASSNNSSTRAYHN
jgi:hypothetical protein